ncbi:hypothetical protein [Burkholderia anthina]|uniref:hypothetical protein n=1 Tax=Burkholderia anthina TaxID=179879 RepID=UPI0037C13944
MTRLIAAFPLVADRNTKPVLTLRYVTSLKHFIRSTAAAPAWPTSRRVWTAASIFRASQSRRDATADAATRVNLARQSDRGAGTEPASRIS